MKPIAVRSHGGFHDQPSDWDFLICVHQWVVFILSTGSVPSYLYEVLCDLGLRRFSFVFLRGLHVHLTQQQQCFRVGSDVFYFYFSPQHQSSVSKARGEWAHLSCSGEVFLSCIVAIDPSGCRGAEGEHELTKHWGFHLNITRVH